MNDLKTLYNARSNKDELAQIAEKLNIQDSSLDAILNGIIDIAGAKKFEMPMLTSFTNVSKAQAAAQLQISESDLDSLFEADVITNQGENGTITLYSTNRYSGLNYQYAAFGSSAGEVGGFGFEIDYTKSSDKCTAKYTEV